MKSKMNQIELDIIHEPSADSPFLIVNKPAGLPSAPLFEGDDSVLTLAAKKFPEILSVHGKKEVEKGLVHRIDTETQGLVLIATSQESYDNLILFQKEGRFEKYYKAIVEQNPRCPNLLGGFPPKELIDSERFSIQSAFRPYGKKGREVRPVTQNAGRAALKKGGSVIYTTDIFLQGDEALCHIRAGYRHQVRCHLAWCGFPVKGDKIYNPKGEDFPSMEFFACKITFPHPLSQIPLTFQM